MKIDRSKRSPNFDAQEISVEFVVLHYTALDLNCTLQHLCDTASKVSAHFVISEQGDIFELVDCLEAPCKRAWHAGQSLFSLDGKTWSAFNDFSVGIELVNLNGNFFYYSKAQYETLFELIRALQQRFPALLSADRILGHEQIAGFRGKCDPGRKFDWHKLFAACYAAQRHPVRKPLLGVLDYYLGTGQLWLAQLTGGKNWAPRFNRQLESSLRSNNKIASILLLVILISLLVWLCL